MRNHTWSVIGRFCIGLLAGLCLMATALPAADMQSHRNFKIPAQALDTALLEFSNQTKVQVLMWASVGPNIRTAGVNGQRTAADALQSILQNTGLAYRQIDKETVAIVDPAHPLPANTSSATPLHLTQIAAPNDETQPPDSTAVRAGDSDDQVTVFGKPTRNVDMRRSSDDALPYQIMTREQIERGGFQNITQLAQSFTANTTDTNAEGGSSLGTNQGGKVEINLRGLGVSNTLILVNGRRLAANMPYSPQGDVSTIPLSAVDQVEMLSSGASAIYGSSAVGGVINLVLRKDYAGTEFDVTYGNTFDTDAGSRRIAFVSGFNSTGRRHNVTFYGDLFDQSSLLAADRGFANRLRTRILDERPALINGGTTPPVASRGNIRSATGAALGIPGNPAAIHAGIPSGYDGTGGLAAFNSTAGAYNLDTRFQAGGGSGSSLIDESEGVALGLNTYHRIAPLINLFTELSYSWREQNGFSARSTQFSVPASNAFNPFGQTVVVSTIAADLGPVGWRSRFDDYRAVAGIEGVFGSSGWRYVFDATYQRNKLPVDYFNTPLGYFFIPPSALGSNDPAAAYNPFLDFSAGERNSQVAIDAMSVNGFTNYDHDLKQGALRFFGDASFLGRKLDVGAGAEFRKERFLEATNSYIRNSTGAVVFFSANSRPATKDRDVVSLYSEVRLPLLGHSSRQRLTLDAGARVEDFSDFGSTVNPIVALLYQPVESVFFRASWGTGFVAPGLEQIDYNDYLGTTPSVVSDPKRGGESASIIDNGHLRRTLQPEESESLSAGLVLTPHTAPGLRLSIDWFRISKQDNITFQSGQRIVNNEDSFPGLVVRDDPAPGDPFGVGVIRQVFLGFLNALESKTEAIDVGLEYAFDAAIGRLTFYGNGTYGRTYEVQLALNSPTTDYLDQPLAWNGAPVKFRGNAGVYWKRGALGAGMSVRHIGGFRAAPGYDDIQGASHVSSSNEVNLQLAYDFNLASARSGGSGWLSNSRLTLNVANLFDETAPFVAGSPTSRGFSEFSSARGVNYSLSLRKNFAN